MNFSDDDYEIYQNQRKLAMKTIDDLTQLKIDLLESEKRIPKFINNAIKHLKNRFLIDEEAKKEEKYR
jgi:hypothetical protein